jgi:hypothetical protein
MNVAPTCPAAPPKSTRTWFIWVKVLNDDLDHAVTDEEMTVGRTPRRGHLRSVCGTTFVPAAMEEEPGLPCTRCGSALVRNLEQTRSRIAPHLQTQY